MQESSWNGVNLRHFMIMDHLIRFGLRKDSKVLEIGCGIGKLTGLLYKYIKRGKIVGMDISNESVEIARKRIPKSPRFDGFATIKFSMANARESLRFE